MPSGNPRLSDASQAPAAADRASGVQKLGRISPVDLREIWTSEDRHFTPWLAQPENLELLGQALSIDLQLEAQEKDVGPFRADLLCKNTAEEDSWVVIENQIEKTDHKHLGQLITYASGLHAKTVVWISSEISEEHRAAIDWLNRIANRSARFFGIEIELWRIGDSPAAPRFSVVCKPNEWEATVDYAKEAIGQMRETVRKSSESATGLHSEISFANTIAHCGHKSRLETIGTASG